MKDTEKNRTSYGVIVKMEDTETEIVVPTWLSRESEKSNAPLLSNAFFAIKAEYDRLAELWRKPKKKHGK